MDDQLKQAIASVYEADPSVFKSKIFDVLSAKVSDRLHAAKAEYASNVFGQSDASDDEEEYEEDSIETEETTDEEV